MTKRDYWKTKTVARTEEDPSLPRVVDSLLATFPSTQSIDPLIIEDLRLRGLYGVEKYGVPLQPFDGTNPLVETYQELMDALVYISQGLLEDLLRDNGRKEAMYVLLSTAVIQSLRMARIMLQVEEDEASS